MIDFTYQKAEGTEQALSAVRGQEAGQEGGTKFLGGGTNLVDLMRENIEQPAHLIDVTGLSRDIIDEGEGLRIGGAVTNTQLANDPRVKKQYPLLSQAILYGASGQSAIWPPWRATCCSEHAAPISTTPPVAATNALLEQAVMPSRGSRECTPSSALPPLASPSTPRTWR